MEQSSISSKIREIISFYGLSDRQFAIKIGVNQSVIGSMFIKGTEPSSKVIYKTLMAFPDISADWFLRNLGEMFKNKEKELERMNSLLDTIVTLQDTITSLKETNSALQTRIAQLEKQVK